MKLETNWDNCPDFIQGKSVGILWTVNAGIPIRYHWNQESQILFKVVGIQSHPVGLCLNMDQALAIALQHYRGL